MKELIDSVVYCLSAHYLINVTSLYQIFSGADANAFIYKAFADDHKKYFVKVKNESIQNKDIFILDFLQTAGISNLIFPIQTKDGKQVQECDGFSYLVYPYIEGQNGFCVPLNGASWVVLGKTLKQIHELKIPSNLKANIRKEEFSPTYRNIVRTFYKDPKLTMTNDVIASNLYHFLLENELLIQRLVNCAEALAQKASLQPLDFVLCHSDIHAGNILIDKNKTLYIVDWDQPIFAPKERDLMFIGAGVGNVWNDQDDITAFYQGYGLTDISLTLLSYYRFERIVEDIAEYIHELLIYPKETSNKAELFNHFMNMFSPNGVVDIAFSTL
jgi:spectinomycin phosphotransferase